MQSVEQVVKNAVDDFISQHYPDIPSEINNGHCRVFVDHVFSEYTLPEGAEEIDAHGVHSWIHYNGTHYDAECPEGVDNANDLPIWHRVSIDTMSELAQRCKHLDPPENSPTSDNKPTENIQ